MAGMEIAGVMCAVCGQKVVFAEDGKCCCYCRIVVHQTDAAESTCTRCGRAYEVYERPVADPVRDAIVPRRLRSTGPGGGVAAILIAATLLLLLMSLFFMMLLHDGH